MKLLALILTSILHLSLASEHCTIIYRKHDRAGIYSRNFWRGENRRWPNKTVPFKINPDFSDSELNNITKAMKMIMDGSCVKFVPYSNEPTFTWIKNSNRVCSGTVGYADGYDSFVFLEKNTYCTSVGTITHELLHVLGYFHEHTRPDRDEYVKIHWDRIKPPNFYEDWFRNLGVNEQKGKICNSSSPIKIFDDCTDTVYAKTFGIPYDYGSIMHYSLNTGGYPHEPVMEALKPIPRYVKIGQRDRLSKYDLQKVKMAYNCYGKDEESCLRQSYDNCARLNLSKCCQFQEVRANCEEICVNFILEKQCRDNVTNCKEVVKVNDLACLKNDFRMSCKRTCGLCQAKCVDKHLDCFNLDTSSCNTGDWNSLCPRKCGKCNDCEDMLKTEICAISASVTCGLDNDVDYVCRKTCNTCT